jgi:hypothetical protein
MGRSSRWIEEISDGSIMIGGQFETFPLRMLMGIEKLVHRSGGASPCSMSSRKNRV